MATTFLTPRAIVTINGIEVRTISGQTSCGFRAAFATASFQMPHYETPPDPGSRVAIQLGYLERGVQLVFSGEIDDHGVEYWPKHISVACSGFLARTQVALGVSSATAPANADTGEIPAYYATGITDLDIVVALLAVWGVPMGEIQGMVPATTFGTIEPVTLGKNEAAWSLIQNLDRLTFMRTFDAPDGTTRRLPINGIPSSAALTLTQAINILTGSLKRSRKGIVNAVTAVGLQDAGGPGVTPRAEFKATSAYIPTPPTYQGEEFQSKLIETEALAANYATNRVGQMNRLQESVQIGIERGRPDIQPAMTIAIDSAALSYGPGTVFWVEQVDHQWDVRAIKTSLALAAATGADGVNTNQAPIVVIDIQIETEFLNGVQIWIVFANGVSSYDPGGTAIDLDPQHGITTYLWSGNPNGPNTPVALPQATYEYASDPTGATITLQVTDLSLKIGTATVTLTADQVAKAGRRDLWAALTADLWLTTDGAATWIATGAPAIRISRRADPTYQLAADVDGVLRKITILDRSTVVVEVIAGVEDVTAVHINVGVDGQGTHRCWVGCADGSAWLSPDDGISWFRKGSIVPIAGTSGPQIRAIEESPFSFGTLYAIAGNALWLSYDEGITWASVRAYPDPALDAISMASGRFADLSQDTSYHWVAFTGDSGDTEQRLLEQENLDEVDWPITRKPAHPIAIALGIYAPEIYVADQQGSGRTFYIDDFTGGGNLVERFWDIIWGVPQDLLPDPTFDGIVYLISHDNILKSTDKLTSIREITSLALPNIGRMIGTGRLRGPLPARGDLIWIGSTLAAMNGIDGEARWTYRLTQTGFRRFVHPLTGGDAATVSLIKTTDGSLISWAWESDRNAVGANNCHRSLDSGETWSLVPVQYVYDVKPGPDGVVYLAAQATSDPYSANTLHRSTDNGATFAPVHTVGPSGGVRAGFNSLFVSPVDGDVVLSKGYWDGGASSSIRLSVNGGVTFTGTGQESNDQAGLQRGPWIGVSPDGNHYYWHRQDTAAFPFKRASLVAPGSVLESTSGHTDAQDPMPFVNAGTDAYNYGTFGVYASANNGATWTQIFNNTTSPTTTDKLNTQSFVPGDDEINDWYALLLNSGVGGQEYALARRLASADPTVEWDDLTPQLLAAFPDAAYYAYREAAVRRAVIG